MRKLQQFFILSLQSSRLKRNNYKIKNLSLDDARNNDELISVAESQLLRTIRKIRENEFSQEVLNSLVEKRAIYKKGRKSQQKMDEIKRLSVEIDNLLYVDDIISVTINHVAHYKKMGKHGFMVNGKKYVRLMAGAGHLRRSTVLFVAEEIRDQLIEILENGLNKDIPVNFGKYGAYLGLYSSSSLTVTTPKIVVVPDLTIKRTRLVDYVEDDNETVSEKTMEIEHNVFDGQGLISTSMAKQWSNDLGLDYDAVSFIIRAPFTKGLLVSFPFHHFANEFGKYDVTDIYGVVHNIMDVDVILTESQFKMWKHYPSISDFVDNCEKNDLSWGVTRVNPKIEKSHFWSSYQYIQVLNNSVDIDELIEDTVKYFKDVSTLDSYKTMVYLMGDDADDKRFNFDRVDSPIIKVLGMEPESIGDPHIRSIIIKTLNKKIRESYTGKLLLNGNYQFVVFDPFALAQHALFPVLPSSELGILKEGEHYSQYWNLKGVKDIVSGRSPLTWRSELNKLNLVKNSKIEKWLGHLYSGIVFNIHGVDMMLYGDADGDGDSIFTTDNSQMVAGTIKNGKPVTYAKNQAPKELLDYEKFIANDANSFNTKIGLITNYSTTYYAMQSTFLPNSEEYQEIEKRLKICRRGQGQEIDKTKGIVTMKFPEWDKKIKGKDLHNRIIVNKRPFWMQYLYPHKKLEWEEHFSNYENYCQIVFEKGIMEIFHSTELTSDEQLILDKFIKHSPLLLGTRGVMDRVSAAMIWSVEEIKENIKNSDFDYTIYMDESVRVKKEIKEQLADIIKLFNKMKRDFYLSTSHEDMIFIIDFIKNKIFEISSDIVELTNCAVELCYADKKSNHDFVWQMFSDGIILNMRRKYGVFTMPIASKHEDFVFLGRAYEIKEFSI